MNYYFGREMDMDNKDYAHLITVIVPIYNMCEYLERCIRSIIDQTYANLEIILVDDGSTDGSEEICEQYSKKDKRIKVIHKKNGGLVSARKKGLQNAIGEYIGFVDADDYIEKTFYEHLLDDLINTHSDISQMGFITESEDKTEYFRCTSEIFDVASDRENYLCNGLILMRNRNFRVFYNVWTKLYKAELIKRAYAIVPDEQQYGEDFISTCSCLLECNILSTVPYEEYHYQLRENSMSHTFPSDNIIHICHLYECVCRIFKKESLYPQIKDAFDEFFILNIIYNIEKLGNINIPRYYFEHINKLKDKKIVIYGMGNVGRDYYLQMSKYNDIVITAVADGNPEKIHFEYRNIIHKDSLSDYQYDLIIIAVCDSVVAHNIFDELVSCGVSEEKICWEKPGTLFQNIIRTT